MKITLNKLKTPSSHAQVYAVTERVIDSFSPTFHQSQWPGELDHCGEWAVLDEMHKLNLIEMTVEDRKLLSSCLWAIFVTTQPQTSIWQRVHSVFNWTRYASTNFEQVQQVADLLTKKAIG